MPLGPSTRSTPAEARAAAAVAKAYAARSARTVCETAIQVHGGIGNTWECMAHVFLRRALLSTEMFGGESPQLALLAQQRWGAATWTFVTRPTRPSSAQRIRSWLPNGATRVNRSHSDDGYWTMLGEWHQQLYEAGFFALTWPSEVRRPRAAPRVRGDRRRGAGAAPAPRRSRASAT